MNCMLTSWFMASMDAVHRDEKSCRMGVASGGPNPATETVSIDNSERVSDLES